jgi:hypothetical protein
LWYRADVNRQHETVNRRVEGTRNQVRKFVESGQVAVRREDWENARVQLSIALALAHSELGLAPMRDQASKALALTHSKIAERARRDTARTKFAAFQRYADEGVIYPSQYTGLEPAGWDVALSSPFGFDWNGTEPSSIGEVALRRLNWIKPFCGMVVISAIVVTWRAARKRWRSSRQHPSVRQTSALAGPHTTNRLKASRSFSSRNSRLQDRPPWLTRPT